MTPNLSSTYAALSDKNRLAILIELCRQEDFLTPIYLVEKLSLSDTIINHHLTVLKDLGIAFSMRQGRNTVYAPNRRFIRELGQNLIDLQSLEKKG